jgi:hypothetical protein
VNYRPRLESGALREMHGLPEQAFDMLVTLLDPSIAHPSSPAGSDHETGHFSSCGSSKRQQRSCKTGVRASR